MVHVSALYSTANSFDLDYYLERHVPMTMGLLGDAVRQASIVRGVAGADANSPPTYAVIATLAFDSTESFQTAFAPHAAQILGDTTNFTDALPTIQISDVLS